MPAAEGATIVGMLHGGGARGARGGFFCAQRATKLLRLSAATQATAQLAAAPLDQRFEALRLRCEIREQTHRIRTHVLAVGPLVLE